MICMQSSKEAYVLLPVKIQPNPGPAANSVFFKDHTLNYPPPQAFFYVWRGAGYCGPPIKSVGSEGSPQVVTYRSLQY